MILKLIFFSLILATLFGISLFGQSNAQVTWNTFEEKDGLFSLQIPSNWNPEEIAEADKLAPVDHMFRYADKGNSFAWLELFISKPLFPNSTAAAESYISNN